MIAGSTLILKGTITSVESETYSLSVEKVLKGKIKPDNTVKISKFKNWTCSSRGEAYSTGQRLIVFLKDNNQDIDVFGIIGSGNEGEVRVLGDNVYISNSPVEQFELLECKETPHGKVAGTVWDVSDFEKVVMSMVNHLSFYNHDVVYQSDIETLASILDSKNCLAISLLTEVKIKSPAGTTEFLLNYLDQDRCCFYRFATSMIEQHNLLNNETIPFLIKVISNCDSYRAILSAAQMLGSLGKIANHTLPSLRKAATNSNDEFIKYTIEHDAIEPIENDNLNRQ